MCLLRLLGFIIFLLGMAVVIALIVGCEPVSPVLPPPPGHEQPVDPNQGCEPPKVLAFCATWCGPCQSAQPTLHWLEKQGIEVIHIDVDQHPELCQQYGVTSYPTFIVYICHKKPVRTQNINEVVQCMWWLKDKDHGETQALPQLP